jgi:ABC-2 type transport system ATP-binding protein
LSEVERICDRVAIINFGKIERQGKLDDLLRGGRNEIVADGLTREFADQIQADLKESIVSFNAGRLIVDAPEDNNVNTIIDSVRSAKGSLVSVTPRRRRLEDLFIETVNKPKEESK